MDVEAIVELEAVIDMGTRYIHYREALDLRVMGVLEDELRGLMCRRRGPRGLCQLCLRTFLTLVELIGALS